MSSTHPISPDIIPDEGLETSGTAVVVLNAYSTAMTRVRNEQKAFDAAVLAWLELNPTASPEEGPTAVATIICHKL